jgi:hypothetical protein
MSFRVNNSNKHSNVLSSSNIEYIISLPEVIKAKQTIDNKSFGSVYFSISLTPEIKNTIFENLGLDLSNLETIPMRWIKGDTIPHIDRGINTFENTYLVYLTDSEGELVVENNSYPITRGSGYVFSENLHHETINTGVEPRLLLGPMSEKGFAVGVPITFSGEGGTTIYIQQINSDIQFSFDQTSWNSISFPATVNNTNTSLGLLKVEFITDITLTTNNHYFICETSHIQFGKTSLKVDGTRPKIDISGVVDYYGLIQNGTDSTNGYDNIYVFNLETRAIGDSILYASEGPGSGWVCQQYFSKGANENYVVNCSSDGPINALCGGIVGPYSGSELGSQLTIIGCSSSGIIGSYAGGIIGGNSGTNGSIKIRSCWSTGEISAWGAGGIAGSNLDNAIINDCYSIGNITGERSGGIVGESAGSDEGMAVIVNNCYSIGNVTGYSSGGIVGAFGNNVSINNCYTTGNVSDNTCGAICGFHNPENNITISNCYTCGTVDGSGHFNGVDVNNHTVTINNSFSEDLSGTSGTWSSTNANTALYSYPQDSSKIGDIWVATVTNQPYELRNMGYSPYTKENIYFMGIEPTLNNLYPPVGDNPIKDMSNNIYTYQINPYNFQSDFFSDMTDFTDENIVAGDKDESDRLQASYWRDLGNDIYDDWGFFYLYDVNTGKYYFPLLSPQNQDNGVITTQTFNTFGRNFTIKHGWSIRGVFKIDVSVADSSSFIFGAYGEVDSEEQRKNLTYNYNIGGETKTLYYHSYRDPDDDANEILYSYIIPKNESENVLFPYEINQVLNDLSIRTKSLTQGVTIYFSKSRDIREFIVNELKVAASESSISYELIPGESAHSAIINGLSYSILQKNKCVFDEDEEEWVYQSVDSTDNTITINSTTGVISTTSSTPVGIYEIYVRNTGSYHISVYVLIVNEPETEPEPEPEPEPESEPIAYNGYVYQRNNNNSGTFIAYKYSGTVTWKRYRSWWKRWPQINK